MDAPDVRTTQKLAHRACREVDSSYEGGSLECLWLRGLLTQRIIDAHVGPPPPDNVYAYLVGAPPEGLWPSGEYFTDGGGGRFSSVPSLR